MNLNLLTFFNLLILIIKSSKVFFFIESIDIFVRALKSYLYFSLIDWPYTLPADIVLIKIFFSSETPGLLSKKSISPCNINK